MSIKLKNVYAVGERAGNFALSQSKIGIAFVNDDGSLNVILDAIPLTGRLYIQGRHVMIKKQRKENVHAEDEDENLENIDGHSHHSTQYRVV